MKPFANVQLIGAILQWAGALLLLAVFVLLRRDGAARRSLGVWTVAWLAYGLATSLVAVESLGLLLGQLPPPWLVSLLTAVYWPAAFAFPGLVLAGAIAVLDSRQSTRLLGAAIGLSLLVGLATTGLGQEALASRVRDILTPVLLFGAAILVLVRATGVRQRGLVFLGSALTLHATMSTLYLLATVGTFREGLLGTTIGILAVSAGYGDLVTLVILGSAIVVLQVQDSFVEVDRVRQERMRAVAASELRLTRIISAAGEAIVTVDARGRIALVNPAAETLFGARSEGLLGRSVEELLPAAAQGRRADGTTFPAEVSRTPLCEDGTLGAVVVVRDLTVQRELQLERERLERQAAESEKMFAIGRIVSGVAHELNNPLAVVLGQSEQLAAEPQTEDVRQGLRLINEQAHRARHIVKDLLAYVRPREEQRTAFILRPVVERVVDAMARHAAATGVSLEVHLPAIAIEAIGDAMALEQVLVNLLDNAITAAREGGLVRVECGLTEREVELAVEDSGAGVDEAHLPRLFEPFFTTKPAGEGTGLGLAVSRGLMEQQGGALTFENRPAPGVGARFRCTLPAVVAPAPAIPAAPRAVAIFPTPPVHTTAGQAEVVIIDDEAAVRATLARMFRRSGWSVREFASGDAGLVHLLAVPVAELPAVVLCDLKMPGVDGQQLFEELRLRRPVALQRLAFVTGDVVAEATARFLAGAARPVVEKPFTMAEVAAVVEELLRMPALGFPAGGAPADT